MKLELGLNCKKSANGLESSGVNSCTVSTLLLVSKLLRKKKVGGIWLGSPRQSNFP